MMQDLEKDLPEDIDATIAFDNTVFIRSSINEVEDTIFEAFLLVVLIIFLFLRSWRTTLIPVLAIPVSLIASFFIMYVAGFTINILTLLAVVLAIGLVVDDAIVVMENIFTKIEQGMSPLQAGFKGSNEIFFAVIATTVVLVAVFFPIVFLEGTTGRLFREFSVVIAGAVVVSSFVALTFTPMISTKLLTRNATQNWFYRKTEPFFRRNESGVPSLVTAILESPLLVNHYTRGFRCSYLFPVVIDSLGNGTFGGPFEYSFEFCRSGRSHLRVYGPLRG